VTDYAIYIVDPSGKVVNWNPGLCRAWRYHGLRAFAAAINANDVETPRGGGRAVRAICWPGSPSARDVTKLEPASVRASSFAPKVGFGKEAWWLISKALGPRPEDWRDVARLLMAGVGMLLLVCVAFSV
jgi:hypothetical protein